MCQKSHWCVRNGIGVSGITLCVRSYIGRSGVTQVSQERHWFDRRDNDVIGETLHGVPEVSLVCQERCSVPGVTLVCQECYLSVRSHSGLSGASLMCQE